MAKTVNGTNAKTVRKMKIIEYEEKIPESLEEFVRWDFTSGITIDEDFKQFARLFKQFVKENLPYRAKLVNFSINHYYLSGFIKGERGGFVYFSISDVRFFKNWWRDKILVRTASSARDYTGGPNNCTNLENFRKAVKELLER